MLIAGIFKLVVSNPLDSSINSNVIAVTGFGDGEFGYICYGYGCEVCRGDRRELDSRKSIIRLLA